MTDANTVGAQWLRYAREDLAEAERIAAGASIPRYACYLGQQAAEKALKAVLIYLQIDYPFVHNLNVIRDVIPAGWSLKAAHPELDDLSHWATAGRYPSDAPEPTIEDARSACAQARAVLDSVVADLKAHGFPA